MIKELDESLEKVSKIGEGSFGKVYLYKEIKKSPSLADENDPNTHNKSTKSSSVSLKLKYSQYDFYALKKLKNCENMNDCKEIKIMKKFHHPNLMSIRDIVEKDKGYKRNKYIVMDYGIEIMELMKHKELNLTPVQLKQILKQIVEGIHHLHQNQIIHRDVKPSNIFITENGTVKVGDFSVSRSTQVPPEDMEKHENGPMSPNMITRYYKPPQIIYGSRKYGLSVDIWSLGCTFAELYLQEKLFPGQSDINQLQLIFKMLGSPGQSWPQASELPYYLEFTMDEKPTGLKSLILEEKLCNLIEWMLSFNPKNRPTTSQILNHNYFQDYDVDLTQLSKLSTYLRNKTLNKLIN